MKSPWYLRFVTGRIENIFSTSNVDLHRRYRRLLSGAMSESSLATHFDTIRSRADHAVIRMTEEIKTRGATDVSKWWFFMTSDVIGELSFGESFHAVERGQVRI
jgi:cytochrome P450